MPFLTIGTQGQESKASSVVDFVDEKIKDDVNEPDALVVQDVQPVKKEE